MPAMRLRILLPSSLWLRLTRVLLSHPRHLLVPPPTQPPSLFSPSPARPILCDLIQGLA